MKKINYLVLSWCLGLTLQFFFSCTNEDNTFINSVTGLETSVDLLKLVDNGTNIAGELSIASDNPEVKLIWNTNEACNLDTTLSSITLKNGRYTLPIKWQKSITDGKFGPEGIAYKAGVQILAGKYSKYVPLIWAEKIDTTKVMESIPTTRAAESIIPKLVQIELTPTTAFMNETIGASVHVGLKNADFVVFDWSEFNSDINIDMSLLPNYITSSQFINFKWTSNGAPSYGFTVNYYAHAEGITQPGTVTFIPSTPSITLSFKASNLPSGNIPYTGEEYTFTFGGSYTGTVQIRCLVNGVVINTGQAVSNKNPKVTVPYNGTTTIRTIKFQYKRADGDWVDLPTSEIRNQNVYADYIEVGGVKWSRGNLQYKNRVYSFMNSQELYTGTENGVWSAASNPDYWAANTITPATVYKNNGDPCKKVAPAGTWRLPTKVELDATAKSGHVSGLYNNVRGTYFGTTSLPSNIAQAATLFLPYAGLATYLNSYKFNGCAWGGFYRGTGGSNNASWLVFYDNDAVPMMVNEISANDPSGCNSGATVRCVKAN